MDASLSGQKNHLLPNALNEIWSMDFMCDTLESGKRFRILTVIDDYNREALIIRPQLIFPGEHVVNALNDLGVFRGIPGQIRVDNEPEFMSKAFVNWSNENGVMIKYIQPGKPEQNAFVERFNRLYREDVLDEYLYSNIEQVQEISEVWKEDHNENHPHGSLRGISPRRYARFGQDGDFVIYNSDEKSKLSLSEKGFNCCITYARTLFILIL